VHFKWIKYSIVLNKCSYKMSLRVPELCGVKSRGKSSGHTLGFACVGDDSESGSYSKDVFLLVLTMLLE
jgi:hypothetical protein